MIEDWKRKKKEAERKKEEEERKRILERERRVREFEERISRLENLRTINIIHNEEDDDGDDADSERDNKQSSNNETIINKLPESKLKDIIINKLNEENKKCLICFDDYVNNDIVTYLPCLHFFHNNCVVKWIKEMPLCPICKLNIKNNLN